ncbi:energy transducer TonB [Rhodocyclus tenuis]|uniref:Protein TonB n=1 Tax=Rhodocyclus tenuis TaxID=1066 RepID=A0A840GCU0_RHOTE|nr:energy transducer TonB [Rhodocyclus tenuis]MBB4248680.1 protein TonB [Rhodocyclus tenuis]
MSSLVDSARAVAAERQPTAPRKRSPASLNRLIGVLVVAGHASLLALLPTGLISPASGSTPAVLVAEWIDAAATAPAEKAIRPLPPMPVPTPKTQAVPKRPAAESPSPPLTSTAAPAPAAATVAASVSNAAATESAAATASAEAAPAGKVSPPRFDADYLKNPPPAYPRTARERGEAGLVVLRVLVSRDGLPLDIDVQRSSGYERLDDAALAAVRHWQFLPARQGGEAVAARVLVPISFNLRS